MIEKIKDYKQEELKNLEVYKISQNSCIYIIKELNLAIDAGLYEEYESIEEEISEIIDPNKIKTVIFTHLHYDHIGCFEIFKNATFYASPKGIESLKTKKEDTILDPKISKLFNIELKNIEDLELPKNFEIIITPGHSIGSLCIYEKENQILFSGDTVFHNGGIGRYDLPTSDYGMLTESLTKLSNYQVKILCPGHDY
jgi:glyoxylase-like metal-dependent hydrolase (beta-lactamase superfamily II)